MPESTPPPLRLAIAGLTHSHVDWVFDRPVSDDIELVGIAESNRDLARRYVAQGGLSMDMVYDTVSEMLDRVVLRLPAIHKLGSVIDV